MIDLERQLRAVLADRARLVEAVPSGIPSSVRRRIRRRQGLLLAVAGLTAALLAAGLTVATTRLPLGTRPIGPGAGSTRPPSDVHQGIAEGVTVVGSGRAHGEDWEVFVDRRDGAWCIGVREERGSAMGCPFTADSGLDLGSSGDSSPKLVYGALSGEVARVTASTVGGDVLPVNVFEVPQHVGAPFGRVWVVAAEGGLVLVTAYDREGDVIGSAGA
jgi:hypothetical protein